MTPLRVPVATPAGQVPHAREEVPENAPFLMARINR